jgi:DNA-binding response OmpR family regulator
MLATRPHASMVAELLRESGFEVVVGKEPAAALARLRAERFKLLVLDELLGDGSRAAALIKGLRRDATAASRKAWVLAMVAVATPENVAELRLAGVSGLLVGGVSVRAVAERLGAMRLDKRRFVEAEGYCGPDRRVRIAFVPPGRDRRQRTALADASP